MVCEHLRQLEDELIAAGVRETFRGRAWTRHCREWVYFDCYLDRDSIRRRIAFEACVADHELLGCHEGQESGFVCERCRDGIMGVHEDHKDEAATVVT